MNIKEIPLIERPREKAFLKGINSLNNYELLAIIIGSGVKNKNAIEISSELINYFNGLSNLFEQSYIELSKIKGLSKIKSLKLNAFFELCKRKEEIAYLESYDRFNIQNFVKKIRKYILNYQIENLIIVTLNNKNKVLCIKNIDFNEKRIKVSCFDVIKFVIQNGAIKFIVVHNHTGNLIEPSLEDLNYTKTLQTEAKKFNLNLIDSIILNREDYFSFFEENLL